MMMNLGTFTPGPLVNYVVYKESDEYIEVTLDEERFLSDHYTAHATPHAYTPSLPFLATMKPTDTLLIGDEIISTTPAKETENFIKSSVDDLDISSLDPPKSAPLNYEPLCNTASVSRSLETSDLNLEELTAENGLDDSIPIEIDDGYYDSEGDILFLEHLLIEETFFDPTLAVLPKKSTLLVTQPPASKQFSLREVERCDLFFSLTQSGGKTRVIETPLFGFHHMPSPRPASYSLKEVMYRYYHPHLTSGDGFDPEIK
nr:hypothetical protein [Tanacetum cinerariifolium]